MIYILRRVHLNHFDFVEWYLIVVLTCTSLITNGIEHRFPFVFKNKILLASNRELYSWRIKDLMLELDSNLPTVEPSLEPWLPHL